MTPVTNEDRAVKRVEYAINLSPKEIKVLFWRAGIRFDGVYSGLMWTEKKTLEEVGKELGVTRERVRQIEAKTVEKLHYILRLSNSI
jgi:RNA polymerase primary sigma factor